MRTYLLVSLLVLTLSFTYSQISYAVCVEGPPDTFTCNTNPPNPDLMGIQEAANPNDLTVNVLPGAEINTQGQPGNLDAIRTGGGNNIVNITGGVLRGQDRGMEVTGLVDSVKVIDSIITSIDRAIETSNGEDTVMVEGSDVTSEEEECIQTGNDDDVVMVNSSKVTGLLSDGIETANHDDQVTINDSIITGGPGFFAVDLGNGNDTMTIGTGAVLNNGIDCRDDFDTLIFAIEVPEEALDFLSSELVNAGLPNGSITINGIFYEWQECEVIVNQLVGVPSVRPIPTLSEWGLIAMAGLLGIVGLMAVRRTKLTA